MFAIGSPLAPSSSLSSFFLFAPANFDMADYPEKTSASSDGSHDKLAAHTLDERRRAALAEIDNAPFSWFHVKVCAVAGVGFFTDA